MATNSLVAGEDHAVVSTLGLVDVNHRVDDFSVSVGSGISWRQLQDQLALAGQRVAVDPPGSGTVGGVVATGARGGLLHRYGGVRDQIIGMTVVLADGTVAHSGGTVIKNVAGYDLAKLLTGARGRFGVIAEVIFRTRPLPESQRTLLIPIDVAEIREVATVLTRAKVEVSALSFAEGSLSCLIEGGEAAIDRRAERLRAAVAISAIEILDDRGSQERWRHLADLQLPVDGGLVFAFSTRSARMLKLLPRVVNALESSLVGYVAYVGAGVVDVSVDGPDAAKRLRDLANVFEVADGSDIDIRVELRARHERCSYTFPIDVEFHLNATTGPLGQVGNDTHLSKAATPGSGLVDRISVALDPNGRFS
jgi:glycolate oxidase FAD binding subunit